MEYETVWTGAVDGQGGELLFQRFSGRCETPLYRQVRVRFAVPKPKVNAVAKVTQALMNAHGNWLSTSRLAQHAGIPYENASDAVRVLMARGQIEATAEPITFPSATGGRPGRGYRWKD